MFRYNPAANYQPNGGRYLQILSGKDLCEQTIVVSDRDTFPARFPNTFVDYLLGSMKVGDRIWMNWNKAPLTLNRPGGGAESAHRLVLPTAVLKRYAVGS